MKEYNISKNAWLDIDIYPWGCDYRPKTQAKIQKGSNGFEITMKSYEKNIRMEKTERNSNVHTDSCMEFFFNAEPEKSKTYMNFEINPKGVMYIGFSKTGDRSGTGPIEAPDNEYFNMKSRITDEYWEISYTVPYEFIKQYFPTFDENKTEYIKANFYKCGDLTKHPHFGVWNNIETEEPDFHRPEFFGVINLR
ncbi:MAG TPA: hypothetical protein GXZ66_02510 [Clostridiaceae bacterium]|jgi:hypothetical protein|nr:hypothetical protein [Clostridiaceae bacterium]